MLLGTLRAGQPLQPEDVRVRGEGRSSVEHDAVHRRGVPFLIEAGSALGEADWEPSAHDWTE